MNRRRVLLTGASGTLGRNLLEMIGNGPSFEILSLLRLQSRSAAEYSKVHETRLDFGDRARVKAVVADFRPQIIVHCAATGMEFPKSEWFDLIRFNVDFTVNLCESAAGAGVSHFIFVGTGLAYRPIPRPLREEDTLDTLHPYGASKAAGDFLVRSAAMEFGLPLTVLRPFSFTGLGDERNRLFPSLLRAAAAGVPMDLSAGRQVRDHLSARDVARGILAAMDAPPSPTAPGVYNLGSGSSLPVRQMVEGVVVELGLSVELNFGAKSPHRFEPEFLVADWSKANRDLGWRPRHRLAHAVWELSRASFPGLNLREPPREIS